MDDYRPVEEPFGPDKPDFEEPENPDAENPENTKEGTENE